MFSAYSPDGFGSEDFIAFSLSVQAPGSIVDAPFAIFHPASVRTRLN
jgi:hypothetical protein